MPDRRDSALIEAAADAARVTDDFVRGVIGLADGEIGDDNQQHSWLQRRLRGRGGQRSVARGMGALYAHEQLRKAANEADEWSSPCPRPRRGLDAAGLDAHGRLAALGVDEIPAILRDPERHLRIAGVAGRPRPARTLDRDPHRGPHRKRSSPRCALPAASPEPRVDRTSHDPTTPTRVTRATLLGCSRSRAPMTSLI
jgi:hypothetical protein